MTSSKHTARIHDELRLAGVTRYGQSKLAVRHLPKLIKLDESIGGVIYGRVRSGSAVLVATNQRILYVDRKPLFTTSDELTYDVVSGVKINTGGPLCTVVLHTRVNDYRLRYVNEDCARKFVHYIEQRRINPGQYDQKKGRFTHNKEREQTKKTASDSASSFLKSQVSGVLSTLNNNRAHGSVVYYTLDDEENVYLVTTPDSRKVQNIANNPQVSLTVFDLKTELTARVEGYASVEQDQAKISQVIEELGRRKTAQYERFTQEVSKKQTELVVIRIEPVRTELTNYQKRN